MAVDRETRAFTDRISGGKGDATTLIHAATVILLREGAEGLETLMLRKNSKIAFAGMWVFPGGRIDDEDGGPSDDIEQRARNAAVREAAEEASLAIDPTGLVWFSHWTPPPVEIRRFSTWFFAARAPESEVVIDDGEITASQWIRPVDALAKQRAGEIELVPPTFVTLHYLSQHANVDDALSELAADPPRHYITQIAPSDEGLVVMWEGDAGYETRDASIAGPRHRLLMTKAGFSFDDSALH
jgi:8-oxo-dGTP pyrophosphatase MutT (NUDIX family)